MGTLFVEWILLILLVYSLIDRPEPIGAGLSMNEYTNSISSIHSTKSVNKRTDIRMMTLEMMRKNYKDYADIINELTNGADTVSDFDRTWNGKSEFLKCAECNGPILGHRVEKC